MTGSESPDQQNSLSWAAGPPQNRKIRSRSDDRYSSARLSRGCYNAHGAQPRSAASRRIVAASQRRPGDPPTYPDDRFSRTVIRRVRLWGSASASTVTSRNMPTYIRRTQKTCVTPPKNIRRSSAVISAEKARGSSLRAHRRPPASTTRRRERVAARRRRG